MIRHIMRLFPISSACGMAYGSLEVLFRGKTHWTMIITAGTAVAIIYAFVLRLKIRLWQKWLLGGVIITTVEFIVGCIVNLILGLNVWDYSARRLNIIGQVCPEFFVIWVCLSIPLIWLLIRYDRMYISRGRAGNDNAYGFGDGKRRNIE